MWPTLIKWFISLDPIAVPNSNLEHSKKKGSVTYKKNLKEIKTSFCLKVMVKGRLTFSLSNYLPFIRHMKGLHQSFDVVQVTTLHINHNKSYEALNKRRLTINLDILTLLKWLYLKKYSTLKAKNFSLCVHVSLSHHNPY